MKLQKKFKITLMIAMSCSTSAFAGVGSSGGGKAVVCNQTTNTTTVQTVELLDLYEAREVYGFNSIVSNEPMEVQLNAAYKKLENSMDQPEIHLMPLVNRVQKIIRFLPKGSHLEAIPDANEIAIPSNCKLEQMASYVDDTLLLVDRDLWDLADVHNHAALLFHEAVYRLLRQNPNVSDSRWARKIVGAAFSDFLFDSILDGIPDPTNAKWYTSEDDKGNLIDRFTVTEHTHHSSRGDYVISELHFLYKNGLPMFTKTVAYIPWRFTDKPYAIGLFTGGDVYSKLESDFFSLGYAQEVSNQQVNSWLYVGRNREKFKIVNY